MSKSFLSKKHQSSMFSLFFVLTSQTVTTISRQSFVMCHIAANDTVWLKLLNTNLHAYVFWSSYANSPINVSQSNGSKIEHHMSSTSMNGFHFTNVITRLKFQSPLTLYVWVLPNSICSSGAYYYKTTGQIKDKIQINENLKSFCTFFVDDVYQAKIKASIKSADNSASIQLHTRHSIKTDEIDNACTGTECSTEKYKPFFAEFKDIPTNSYISFDYTLYTKPRGTESCIRNKFYDVTNAMASNQPISIIGTNDVQCSIAWFTDMTWAVSAALIASIGVLTVILIIRRCFALNQKIEPEFNSPLNQEEDNDMPQSEFAKRMQRDVSKEELPEEKQLRIAYQQNTL